MKKFLSAIIVLSLAGAASAQNIEVGAGIGYNGGLAIEGTVHAPASIGRLGLRGDVGYTQLSKEESNLKGSNIVMGAGVTYPIIRNSRGLDAHVHGGVRYSVANATETKVLTNTRSRNAFGIGGGVQVSHPVATNVRMTGDVGIDHFFKAPIKTMVGGVEATIKPDSSIYENSAFVPDTNFKARVGIKTSF